MISLELRAEMEGALTQIDGFANGLQRELTIAATQATALLHDEVAQYPPATQANEPPGSTNPRTGKPYGHWYIRGVGTGYLSGKIDRTSQQLGRSWTETIRSTPTEWDAVVGTRVTYAPEVQGDRQASYHAAHGWRTVRTVAQLVENKVVQIFNAAVQRLAGK